MNLHFPRSASELLAALPADLEAFSIQLCTRLMSEFGATLYVKTIYVGVEIGGEMVAALYPASSHLDVALALEEDHASPLLEDATHLTWPSLPVLVSISAGTDRSLVEALVDEAAKRVVNSEHHVSRSPDYFRGRAQRLSHDPRSRFSGRAR